MQELRLPSAFVAIYEDGRLLDCAAPLRKTALPLAAGTSTMPFGAHGARIAVRPFQWKSRNFTIAVVEPLDSVAGQLEALRHVLYVALPLAILIAGLGGFCSPAKASRRWSSISEQAEAITDGTSTRGSRPRARDWSSPAWLLCLTNALAPGSLFRAHARLHGGRFHELRTPLSIIRGEADVALAHNRQPAEYRESLAIIQDEARRLTRLVEDLFNLARADAGHINSAEELYLNDLLEECCRSAQAQARQKGRAPGQHGNSDVPFRGDAALLRRLISNLLDNAIRYTPSGGQVEARLEHCSRQRRG